MTSPQSDSVSPAPCSAPESPRSRLARALTIAAILVVAGALAVRCAVNMSLTVDEAGQMVLGDLLRKSRDFETLTTWGTAPIPVIATAWLPAALDPDAPRDTPEFTLRRRLLNLLLFGGPLLAGLFLALRATSGFAAAAIGTALLGFSPMFLAHSVIAATDIAASCFILLAVIAVVRYAEQTSWRRLLIAAAAIGVAMAAKQTAVILFGVSGLILLATAGQAVRAGAPWTQELVRTIGRVTALGAVAVVATWAFYGFHLTTLAGPGPWRPHFSWAGTDAFSQALVHAGRTWMLPASWVSFVVQLVHNHAGHGTFLLGAQQAKGHWYYWPIAALLKFSIPEFLVLALLVLRLSMLATWRAARTAVPALTLVLIVAGCISSNLNLGLRYMLPAAALALLVVFSGLDAAPRWYRRGAIVGGVALAVGQLLTAWQASPNQLGYLNGLFARRNDAHWLVTDANIDWGHGVPALKPALERVGAQRPTVALWGYLKPQYHGIACQSWWTSPSDAILQSDWFVVSASVLHGGDNPVSRALTGLEPDEFAGPDLLLFAMRRPEVQRSIARALVVRGNITPLLP